MLGTESRPLFFPVSNAGELGLEPPEDRHGASVRTWVRSLAGMQKEALVINGATAKAWRFASDEGAYLAGHDSGPCPLSFMTTGMVASYMNEITALAASHRIDIRDIRLTLDNHYSMEGSVLRGTMVGGALPPDLTVEIESPADRAAVQSIVAQAVDASSVTGLMRGVHESVFTLCHNGIQIDVDRVSALEAPAQSDPGNRFLEAKDGRVVTSEPILRKLAEGEKRTGIKHGVNSSLQEKQSRTLHIRGVCTLGEDGVKHIEQHLFKPIGSSFHFLSDEAPAHGGKGLAPDAASYMAAGIGFCFMTQFGRYAEIVRKKLSGYRIVQDTYFPLGGASGGTGEAGAADAVETHVYLDTPEDETFSRTVLDIGEQTCFLHAFCRTALETRFRLTAG
jgi:uncharacterized OsmC-like protein